MKTIKLLIISFFLIFSSKIYAQDLLYITKIDKQKDFISIELNNSLEIHNLKITDNNNTKTIISPQYQNKSTKYSYFSFLNKQFKEDIINSINTNKITEQEDYKIAYKINKFKIINSKTLKATFSIIFNDLFEVNATIMDGKNGLCVQWPSQKKEDKWNKIFIIKDKNLKKDIEDKIINKYNKDIENDKFKK